MFFLLNFAMKSSLLPLTLFVVGGKKKQNQFTLFKQVVRIRDDNFDGYYSFLQRFFGNCSIFILADVQPTDRNRILKMFSSLSLFLLLR